MDINKYQKAANATAVYPGQGGFMGLAYAGLGVAGEAGEVADNIKKAWRDDSEVTLERRKKIGLELGDVLWYIAQVATELEYDLDEIAAMNIEKLASRRARGQLGGSGDDR